jgi:phage terminase large subunit
LPEIKIPNNWSPRDYQQPAWEYLENGGKRAVLVWHRRSGKDSLSTNYTAFAAHRKVGTYWHLLPTAKQARKVIWDAINPDTGKRMIDQLFPLDVRKGGNEGKREDEMLIRLACGSNWQLAGSDNYNSLVGANVLGVVFSEWSLCDPRSWDYIRPILAENGGWAIFIYTPRGRNHGYDLANMAKANKDWYYSQLTIDDTKRADGSPVISPRLIDEERKSGMADEMIEQEYYCSFDAPLVGAYYSKQMTEMLKDKRIGKVPYDRALPVETWWDLGMDDSTAIGFVQRVGKEIRAIDYYESSGQDLAHYAKLVLNKPYAYSDHILPHDVMVRELGTGKSREEVLKSLGIKCRVAPNIGLMDGIDAVRRILPQMWMDETKCERWIEALRQYHKEFDDKHKIYKATPCHDWTSHSADMTRYGAVITPKLKRSGPSPQPKIKVL